MSEQIPWNQPDGSTPPPAPPIPPTPPQEYQRRGGITAGVILIALGIFFLASQFVAGFAWWQMWPLLLVLIGVIQLVTPDARNGWGLSRVADGIGTVLLGLVLLGCTTGFISWGMWLTLLTLWPVLLVAIGVAIIGRALGQSWIRALSPLVIWVTIAYAVAVSLTGMGGYQPIRPIAYRQATERFDISKPIAGAERARLTLNGGSGDITLRDTSGELVTAQGSSPFGAPTLSVSREGTSADVRIGLDSHSNSGFVMPGIVMGRADVGLADSVVWDATLDTGATNLLADLTRVKLASLTLKTGVSTADLRLGRPDAETGASVPIVVKSGVSSVTIRIPHGVAARVRASDGLSTTDISSDLPAQVDGSWATPGFSATEAGYDIQIDSGVGSVSIRTY